MPGGWTLSMVWTPMPGETWAGGGARFVAMWLVMMVAMMLPPLLPMLTRLRGNRLAALAGVAYFSVWALCGVAVYAVGAPSPVPSSRGQPSRGSHRPPRGPRCSSPASCS